MKEELEYLVEFIDRSGSLSRGYSRHPIYTDGAPWYPEATARYHAKLINRNRS